jgi:MOSC domain-containing protein YiiM
VVTRDVPLNHLVGKTFRVGGAVLRGVTLCEPCGHIVEMTRVRGLMGAMLHRGGLHAEIVAGGEITIGDRISLEVMG